MTATKRLSGKVVGTNTLTSSQLAEMYQLMIENYDNVDKDVFESDLRDKRDVILLKGDEDRIKGFSTLALLEQTVNDRTITALFSGDTIIDRNYWGENELPKWWGKYAFSLIDEMPGRELYWFLMSKGYKTYRFLPVFFNEFYPRHDREFPSYEKNVLDTFALGKYPENYNPQTGVISFGGAKDRLKEGVADIDESRLGNSHVKFFVERNPGWQQGDELACLVKLTKDNFNRMGHRVIQGE